MNLDRVALPKDAGSPHRINPFSVIPPITVTSPVKENDGYVATTQICTRTNKRTEYLGMGVDRHGGATRALASSTDTDDVAIETQEGVVSSQSNIIDGCMHFLDVETCVDDVPYQGGVPYRDDVTSLDIIPKDILTNQEVTPRPEVIFSQDVIPNPDVTRKPSALNIIPNQDDNHVTGTKAIRKPRSSIIDEASNNIEPSPDELICSPQGHLGTHREPALGLGVGGERGMDERKLRPSTKHNASRLFHPVVRHPTHHPQEALSVKDFIRALTRFQPRQDTWEDEITTIRSSVSDEIRRLHRRDNAAFILTPRSPHAEFRPRSAQADCQKEFVPKTNISFRSPAQKMPRRSIKSAPPSTQRTQVKAGRFEHNILQDEYYELHGMLKKTSVQRETVKQIVAHPVGVYSDQYTSTHHRIFCIDENVGMGYFRRFKDDLLGNLSIDTRKVERRQESTPREPESTPREPEPDPEVQVLLEDRPMNLDNSLFDEAAENAQRRLSSCGSISSFNSNGEVQTGRVNAPDNDHVNNDCRGVENTSHPLTNSPVMSKDMCTSTADDKFFIDASFLPKLDEDEETGFEHEIEHSDV